MKTIIRHVEIPKWTRADVQGFFPGYKVIGSTYGWFAAVHETQTVFMDLSWKEVVRAIERHRKGNSLPVRPDLNYELMVEFCQITQSPACAEADTNAPEREHFMTMASRFLRAMQDAVVNGLVPQEEAERRAAICAVCPKNQDDKYTVCGGCAAQSAAAKIAKFAMNKSTPFDSQLRACAVCHCKLPLKIWINREPMDYPELRDRWDSSCWMLAKNDLA